MADISAIKLPDNTTYNIKDATARANSGVTGVKGNAESSYRKGNVNLTAANVGAIKISENGNTQQLLRPNGLQGSSDVTLQGLFNVTRANRLAYLPADQIIIEKTTDGGTTWTDAGFTDIQKRHLFAETRGSNLALPQIDGKKNLLCGLRITISAMRYNVPDGTAETQKYNYWNSNYIVSTQRYCQLKEFYFWISASNDSMGIKVERATGAKSTNWQTCFEDNAFYMTGWSGSDYIRLNYQSTFGGGTSQTENHWNYRFTLMTKGANGTNTMGTGFETQTQTISDIRGYGDSVWSIPNQYMAYDRIYTQDVDKNVTFPARVTASSFSGSLIGNVTGNVSGTASNVTGTVAVANGGTGKTNGKDAANYFMNTLDTGSSTPADADYYISQYVNGGTTTTTYHRRPMSALWEYIKGKISTILGLTVSTYGGSAAKVNNHTVESNVPANAKFTDTVTTVTTTGTGNAVTAISASNGALTVTKGATYSNNVGTITGVTAGAGLSGGGTSGSVTLKHSNSVTAQSTQALYPIKIDAQGHINGYGTAVTDATTTNTGLMSATDKTFIEDIKTEWGQIKNKVGQAKPYLKLDTSISQDAALYNAIINLGWNNVIQDYDYDDGDKVTQDGALLKLDTSSASGTPDGDLYAAIVALNWQNDVIVL